MSLECNYTTVCIAIQPVVVVPVPGLRIRNNTENEIYRQDTVAINHQCDECVLSSYQVQ